MAQRNPGRIRAVLTTLVYCRLSTLGPIEIFSGVSRPISQRQPGTVQLSCTGVSESLSLPYGDAGAIIFLCWDLRCLGPSTMRIFMKQKTKRLESKKGQKGKRYLSWRLNVSNSVAEHLGNGSSLGMLLLQQNHKVGTLKGNGSSWAEAAKSQSWHFEPQNIHGDGNLPGRCAVPRWQTSAALTVHI